MISGSTKKGSNLTFRSRCRERFTSLYKCRGEKFYKMFVVSKIVGGYFGMLIKETEYRRQENTSGIIGIAVMRLGYAVK